MCLRDLYHLSDYYITWFNYNYIAIRLTRDTSHFNAFFIEFTDWAQWALRDAIDLSYVLTPEAGAVILLFKRFKHISHEISSSEKRKHPLHHIPVLVHKALFSII